MTQEQILGILALLGRLQGENTKLTEQNRALQQQVAKFTAEANAASAQPPPQRVPVREIPTSPQGGLRDLFRRNRGTHRTGPH